MTLLTFAVLLLKLIGACNMNDYRPRPYYNVVKTDVAESTPKHVLDLFLDELHAAQLEMIDQAVEYSDMQQAKDIIEYIKNK